MAIFEIAKNGIWPKKKVREIDLFDFTSFFAWTLFNFLVCYDEILVFYLFVNIFLFTIFCLFTDLIKEGEWHHVIVVLNRQVLKNSSFSLYVNGQHIATQKIHFISPTPGGGAGFSGGNLTLASSVYAYIG